MNKKEKELRDILWCVHLYIDQGKYGSQFCVKCNAAGKCLKTGVHSYYSFVDTYNVDLTLVYCFSEELCRVLMESWMGWS